MFSVQATYYKLSESLALGVHSAATPSLLHQGKRVEVVQHLLMCTNRPLIKLTLCHIQHTWGILEY